MLVRFVCRLSLINYFYSTSGALSLFDTSDAPKMIQGQTVTWLTAFFMTFCTLLLPVTRYGFRRNKEFNACNAEFLVDTMPKEFHPLSPLKFREADDLSSVLKRLHELEEKVMILQAIPSEIEYQRQELLNAAINRVDALEAELIATKKVCSLYHLLWTIIILISAYSNWYRCIDCKHLSVHSVTIFEIIH